MKNTHPEEPVSEFVRLLIEEWEAGGRTLKELAIRAGHANGKWSMPSQIKARSSDVTFHTAPRFARAFGYTDVPALVVAAYTWWRKGARDEVPDGETEQTVAARFALEHGVTTEHIERALRRYPVEESAEKDAVWWLSRFHEERSLDRKIENLESRALRRHENWQASQTTKAARAAWRKKSAATKSKATATPRRRRVG